MTNRLTFEKSTLPYSATTNAVLWYTSKSDGKKKLLRIGSYWWHGSNEYRAVFGWTQKEKTFETSEQCEEWLEGLYAYFADIIATSIGR